MPSWIRWLRLITTLCFLSAHNQLSLPLSRQDHLCELVCQHEDKYRIVQVLPARSTAVKNCRQYLKSQPRRGPQKVDAEAVRPPACLQQGPAEDASHEGGSQFTGTCCLMIDQSKPSASQRCSSQNERRPCRSYSWSRIMRAVAVQYLTTWQPTLICLH